MHLSTVDDFRRGSAAVRVLSGDVASSVDLLSRSPFPKGQSAGSLGRRADRLQICCGCCLVGGYLDRVKKIELHTERLSLEAPSSADIDAITEACQDPEIRRWVPIPVPYTRREGEAYVTGYSDSGWASGRCCTWAIHKDDEFAGAIGLDDIGRGQATIGFWMAPPFRGRGLLTEAAHAVVEFGFASAPEGLSLMRIEWHANAGNVASARVARRVGFQFEGTLRLGVMGRQIREDDWVAGMLSTDARRPTGWAILP